MSTLLSLLILSLLHLLLRNPITTAAASSPPFSAIYVFGDSTVDPGNNNHIPEAFKANHYPYGMDYPGRVATGRFSNGMLATDFLASSLGIKESIPAYLDPHVTDKEILTGVSFASGGSGLDDLTVKVTHALDLPGQIKYFQEAVNRMKRAVGGERTARTVQNAMVFISVGTNDMVINYFDLQIRALEYSPSQYSDFLLNKLSFVIQSLYKLGARRFAVVGMPPTGCLPLQVTADSVIPSTHWLQRVCVDSQNEASRIYNSKLQNLLKQLHTQHLDARFAYADIYYNTQDMINHPQLYGFTGTLEGCCGTGDLEVAELCSSAMPICPNPSHYIFWDSIHPSQATHRIIANQLLPSLRSNLLT